MKKILLCFLCMLLITSMFWGCNNQKNPSSETEATVETESPEKSYGNKFTEITDCEGYEFTLLTRACCPSHVSGFYVDDYAEGNAIDSAVFKRTNKVEETLGCFLNYTTIPDAYPEALVNAEHGGINICDVALVHAQYIGAVALSGYLADLGGIDTIEWDHPWWQQAVIEANSINGHFFATRGVIDVESLTQLSCLYFNKQILANDFTEEVDLFKIVSDGDWTIELMQEMVLKAGRNLNGDSKITLEDDQFGFVTEPGYMNIWQYALGQMTTKRNENGIPVLYGYTERMQSIVEKMREMVYSDASWCETGTTTANTLKRSLFMMGQLADVVNDQEFRDLKDIYGIIPLPKYSKTEEYVSHAVGHSDQICVPKTAAGENLSQVSTILEALVYYGYDIIRPVVYEEALQYRYVSDPQSGGAMLDIILNSVTSDFAEFATASDQSLLHKVTYILDKLAGTENSIGYNGYLKTLEGADQVLADYVAKFQSYSTQP